MNWIRNPGSLKKWLISCLIILLVGVFGSLLSNIQLPPPQTTTSGGYQPPSSNNRTQPGPIIIFTDPYQPDNYRDEYEVPPRSNTQPGGGYETQEDVPNPSPYNPPPYSSGGSEGTSGDYYDSFPSDSGSNGGSDPTGSSYDPSTDDSDGYDPSPSYIPSTDDSEGW